MRRGVSAFVLAAAATLWTSGVGAAPPATKTVPDEPYPEEFKARVTAEIQRGARKLLKMLERRGPGIASNTSGHDVGERALLLLTLLKCGVPLDTPIVAASFTALRERPPKTTYEAGVTLMALAARYDGLYDPFATDIVDAAGRHVVPPPTTETLDAADRAWMVAGIEFLVKAQHFWRIPWNPDAKARKVPPPGKAAPPDPPPELPKGWGYPGTQNDGRADWIDVSNTQYALLGLKAASRCGLSVPETAWSRALALLLEWQEKEGLSVDWRGNEVKGANRLEWKERAGARGFAYGGPSYKGEEITGGRTAAAAVGLMICQSELWTSARFSAATQVRTRTAVRDALAWLQVKFRADANPGDNAYAVQPAKKSEDAVGFYDPTYASYLYAMERMGVLAHMRYLGENDWYREGAEAILAQRADKAHLVPDADQCFELLFLKRASFRTSIPVVTPDPAPARDGRDGGAGTPAGK